MKKLFLGFVFLLILGIGFFLFSQNTTQQTSSKEQSEQVAISPTAAVTSITASFTIVTRGTTRIFTDPKYHNQSEDVYVELPDPSVVHVKKSGVTWGDFFRTLPMSLSKECLITGTQQTFCTSSSEKLRFFIDTTETTDALEKTIQAGERLLVTYGK